MEQHVRFGPVKTVRAGTFLSAILTLEGLDLKSASASAHGLQDNILTAQAITDLESTVRFITKDNPDSAKPSVA